MFQQLINNQFHLKKLLILMTKLHKSLTVKNKRSQIIQTVVLSLCFTSMLYNTVKIVNNELFSCQKRTKIRIL